MEEQLIILKLELTKARSELKQAQNLIQEKDITLLKSKNSNNIDNDDNELGTSKSSLHLKQELIHVRQILEDSEQDRLKERKEKLSAIQNMIKLTKEKSELLEELDARKKSDVNETGEKFSRLSTKLTECESKLQKLRQEKANELEETQRKYMDEIRQIKIENVTENEHLQKEIVTLKETLSNYVSDSNTSAISYIGGRWSIIQTADNKHIQEMTEIIRELEVEGLGPNNTSSDEIVRVLYNRWKDLESISGQEQNDSKKSTLQSLREEKRSMKRKIEDLQEANALKDGQMKVLEMSLKRQIEDLLTEKKSAFFQMQKSIDLADNIRHETDELRIDHLKTEHTLNRKVTEVDMMRENLLNLTSQLKVVDAEFSKLKRDFSVKDAELNSVIQDLNLAQSHINTTAKANKSATTDSEDKNKVIQESEKTIIELEEQVQNVQDSLSNSKLRCSRLQKERDDSIEDITDLKICINQSKSDSSRDNEIITNLRNQVSMLEEAHSEKSRQSIAAHLEIKTTGTNLLAAHHLLKSEENRSTSLERDMEAILSQLEQKETENELLRDKVNDLESKLVETLNDCDSMKSGQSSLNQHLQSASNIQSKLEEENFDLKGNLNTLQSEHRNLQTRHRQTTEAVVKDKGVIEILEEKLAESMDNLEDQARSLMEISKEKKKLENEQKLLLRENQELTKELEDNIITTSEESDHTKQLKIKLEHAFQTHTNLKKELEMQLRENDEIIAEEKCKIKNKEKEIKNVNKDIEMACEILSDGIMGNNNEIEDGRSSSVDDLIFMAEIATKQLKKSQLLIKSKDQERIDLQDECDELRTDLLKQRKLIINEKAKNEDYQQSLENTKKMDSSSHQQLKDLKSELENLQVKNNKLQSEINEKTSALKEAKHVLRETKSKYGEHLKQIYNASNEELSKASKDCENLTREIRLRDQEISQLRYTFEKVENDNNNSFGITHRPLMKDSDIENMKTEFNQMKIENESLSNQCDILIKRQNQQRLLNQQNQLTDDRGFKQMRCDNIALQNNVIELEVDNAKLRRSLEKYHHRLKVMKKKVHHRGKHGNGSHQVIVYQELEKEHNEKIEAMDCLKSLVRDNETLTECISDLHRQFEAQRKELIKQKQLVRRADQSSLREQEMTNYLKDVLETTLEREKELQCNEIVELTALLEDKRSEVDKLRCRLNEVEREMISKDQQLNKATSETFNLRATMEVTIGNQLTQRRNDTSVTFATSTPADRGNFMKRMTSLEASNNLLQKRLMDMQKWHHAIETELVQSSPMRGNWEQFLRNSLNNFGSTLNAMD